MNFTTYDQYKTAVLGLLDASTDNFGNAAAIDDAIELSEARIWGDSALNWAQEEQTLAAPIRHNVATLPLRFEAAHVLSVNNGRSLTIVGPEDLRNMLSVPAGGPARFVAIEKDKAIFYPQVAEGTLTGSYFQSSPAFRSAPTVVPSEYQSYPRLYMFAACAEIAGVLQMVKQEVRYATKFENERKRAILRERARRFSGRRLVRAAGIAFVEHMLRGRAHNVVTAVTAPPVAANAGVPSAPQMLTPMRTTTGVIFTAAV